MVTSSPTTGLTPVSGNATCESISNFSKRMVALSPFLLMTSTRAIIVAVLSSNLCITTPLEPTTNADESAIMALVSLASNIFVLYSSKRGFASRKEPTKNRQTPNNSLFNGNSLYLMAVIIL